MCARRSRSFSSRKKWILAAGVALILGYLSYIRYWVPKETSTDVFSLLQSNGFTPNPAFSGLLRPGNIIQVTELGKDGKDQPMAVPLLFAWGDECFPGLLPRTEEFTLPQGTGSLSAGLTVSREAVSRLIPTLNLRSDAVADYSLKLENTRVQAFAKGDLSGGFSKPCVEKLKTAIRAGDRIEWFNLVLASVVADAVTLHVQWKVNSSADARSQVVENAKAALAQSGTARGGSTGDTSLKVGITNTGSRETTIAAKGFVIIGYQARSIQPDTSH